MEKEKAVVIASGGIDSSTLLYKVVHDGLDAKALTFLYGQKHVREIESAKKISSLLQVVHKVIDISPVSELLSGSALTDASVNIPEVPASAEHYDTLASTIVPNRNAIFLSLAVGYAVSIGARKVYFGAHFSDRGIYPDCREEFVEAFQSASRLAVDIDDLVVEAPFVGMTKSEIVELGRELGIPFELTWSCYKGREKHCGVCSSCRERKRAFAEAGALDPTEYAE